MDKINKASEDFGGFLHDYRLKHNLSLQNMSEIVGYSASYILRIEKYERIPGLDTKLRILLEIWTMEDIYLYLQEIVSRVKKIS